MLDKKLELLYKRRQKLTPDPQTDSFRGMFVSEDEFIRLIGGQGGDEGLEAEELDLLASIRETETFIAQRLEESRKTGVFLPLSYVSSVFGLSLVEERFIMLGLAVELDRKYERIFGFLQDDLTSKTPNISLALQGVSGDVDFRVMSGKFRFTPGQIRRALTLARGYSAWQREPQAAGEGSGDVSPPHALRADALYKACYQQVQHRLERKATRIEPRYGWADVILPPEQKDQLRNACNQVKYRGVVYGDWGFEKKLAYGKGLSMLFAGPPGTGKTMSAQVVAGDLQLELYKVDLSQVIFSATYHPRLVTSECPNSYLSHQLLVRVPISRPQPTISV